MGPHRPWHSALAHRRNSQRCSPAVRMASLRPELQSARDPRARVGGSIPINAPAVAPLDLRHGTIRIAYRDQIGPARREKYALPTKLSVLRSDLIWSSLDDDPLPRKSSDLTGSGPTRAKRSRARQCLTFENGDTCRLSGKAVWPIGSDVRLNAMLPICDDRRLTCQSYTAPPPHPRSCTTGRRRNPSDRARKPPRTVS